MEKVKVELNKEAIAKALILWNVGLESDDVGYQKILVELPWIRKWYKYMTWEEAYSKWIRKVIGIRDESIFPIEYINDYLTAFVSYNDAKSQERQAARRRLTDWANQVADKLINAYSKAINELNKRIDDEKSWYGIIEKYVGYNTLGEAQYKRFAIIEGNTKGEVIKDLLNVVEGMFESMKGCLHIYSDKLLNNKEVVMNCCCKFYLTNDMK